MQQPEPYHNFSFEGFKNDRTYWATTIAIMNSGSSNILQWPLDFDLASLLLLPSIFLSGS